MLDLGLSFRLFAAFFRASYVWKCPRLVYDVCAVVRRLLTAGDAPPHRFQYRRYPPLQPRLLISSGGGQRPPLGPAVAQEPPKQTPCCSAPPPIAHGRQLMKPLARERRYPSAEASPGCPHLSRRDRDSPRERRSELERTDAPSPVPAAKWTFRFST